MGEEKNAAAYFWALCQDCVYGPPPLRFGGILSLPFKGRGVPAYGESAVVARSADCNPDPAVKRSQECYRAGIRMRHQKKARVGCAGLGSGAAWAARPGGVARGRQRWNPSLGRYVVVGSGVATGWGTAAGGGVVAGRCVTASGVAAACGVAVEALAGIAAAASTRAARSTVGPPSGCGWGTPAGLAVSIGGSLRPNGSSSAAAAASR